MIKKRNKPLPPDYRIPKDDERLMAECRIDLFRAGGPGGQHQNKVESGVRLTHLPTRIVTTERRSRSQHRNKERALRRLRHKLDERAKPTKRRIPTRPPRGARERRLEEKRRRARTKELRKRPSEE